MSDITHEDVFTLQETLKDFDVYFPEHYIATNYYQIKATFINPDLLKSYKEYENVYDWIAQELDKGNDSAHNAKMLWYKAICERIHNPDLKVKILDSLNMGMLSLIVKHYDDMPCTLEKIRDALAEDIRKSLFNNERMLPDNNGPGFVIYRTKRKNEGA
jgi:hypothetical protein